MAHGSMCESHIGGECDCGMRWTSDERAINPGEPGNDVTVKCPYGCGAVVAIIAAGHQFGGGRVEWYKSVIMALAREVAKYRRQLGDANCEVGEVVEEAVRAMEAK